MYQKTARDYEGGAHLRAPLVGEELAGVRR